VKETKVPVDTNISQRLAIVNVAKVHKPNVSVQVQEKVTLTSAASMDAHDMKLKGVKKVRVPWFR
jgi:hypothetical protein